MSDSSPAVAIVILVCFAVGFWIVSTALRKRSFGFLQDAKTGPRVERGGDSASIESYYRSVIGVSPWACEEEIRAAYHKEIAKYHPDKVAHLGDEFHDLASRRSKEIVAAYAFLKSKRD